MDVSFWMNRPITDFELNQKAASVVYALLPFASSVLQQTFQEFFPDQPYSLAIQGDDIRPNAFVVIDGDNCLIFVSGAINDGQIEAIKDSWNARYPFTTADTASVRGVYTNAWVSARRIQLAARLDTTGFTGPKRIRVFGHSYGGMIAHCLHAIYRTYGYVRCEAISYGSPRCGNSDFAQACGVGSNLRWQLQGDPVPSLPPIGGDAPAVVGLLVGYSFFNRLSRWVHVRGGKAMLSVGDAVDQENVLLGQQFVSPDVGGTWVMKIDELKANHAMFAYRAWFNDRVASKIPAPMLPPAIPVPRPATLRTREINAAIQIGDAAIETDIAATPSQIRDYQITPITPTSTDHYAVRKEGSLWFVVRQGKVVDVGPGKRHAKQIARRLNKAAKVNH